MYRKVRFFAGVSLNIITDGIAVLNTMHTPEPYLFSSRKQSRPAHTRAAAVTIILRSARGNINTGITSRRSPSTTTSTISTSSVRTKFTHRFTTGTCADHGREEKIFIKMHFSTLSTRILMRTRGWLQRRTVYLSRALLTGRQRHMGRPSDRGASGGLTSG